MKKYLGLTISCGLLMLLTGCSNRHIYDAVQQSQRINCQNQPSQALYEECMSGANQSYEDYDYERRKQGN